MPVNPGTCWQYIAKGLQKIPWSLLSAGKPCSLLWFLCLQGEVMKDFDLLTCTNFDSTVNLKRNWKKNTTCQNQLNLMHSHSFHWEKKSTSVAWEIHGVEILDSLPVVRPLWLAVKVKLLACITEVIRDGLHCHTLPNAKIFVSDQGHLCVGQRTRVLTVECSLSTLGPFSLAATNNSFEQVFYIFLSQAAVQ